MASGAAGGLFRRRLRCESFVGDGGVQGAEAKRRARPSTQQQLQFPSARHPKGQRRSGHGVHTHCSSCADSEGRRHLRFAVQLIRPSDQYQHLVQELCQQLQGNRHGGSHDDV